MLHTVTIGGAENLHEIHVANWMMDTHHSIFTMKLCIGVCLYCACGSPNVALGRCRPLIGGGTSIFLGLEQILHKIFSAF